MENKNGNTAGTLKVSAGVIVSIAETAAVETEGVALDEGNKLAVESSSSITAKFLSPIRVKLSPDSAVINIDIVTQAGYKSFEVAKAVQEHVKSAVQNMTGITVSKVNVKVTAVRNK